MPANAYWASTHPAGRYDGQYECDCGRVTPNQRQLLLHVTLAHFDDPILAARVLSAHQFKTYQRNIKKIGLDTLAEDIDNAQN